MFGKEQFGKMKRTAVFVNTARGPLVDQAALAEALRSGTIFAAGLDVTDPEPLPPEHPLWRAPNVLITPHVSAEIDTGDGPRWLIARENLRRYAAGGRLLSEVDVAKGY